MIRGPLMSKSIGDLFRQERVSRRLRLTDVAAQLHIAGSQLSRAENGMPVSFRLAEAICKYYGLDYHKIFTTQMPEVHGIVPELASKLEQMAQSDQRKILNMVIAMGFSLAADCNAGNVKSAA